MTDGSAWEVARETTVLCAVRGPGESELVTALSAPGSGIVVTRRCADVAELLAAAAAGAGIVAVVSADLPSVDREVVAHLHADGLRVVAISDGLPWQADRLRALGVDAVVDQDAIAMLVAAVRGEVSVDGSVPGPDQGAGPEVEALVPDGAPPVRRGRVLAVWGPAGAPGRTTLAVNLAAELAGVAPPSRRRRPTARSGRRSATSPAVSPSGGGAAAEVLLVDADTYAASVAQQLGLLDESPGLAAAARSAGHGSLEPEDLARLTPSALPRLRVLSGITRASRWPELPGTSLDVVWERARELADWTVIDCGFNLEHDELLSYDTRAPQRNGATRSALAAADVVVVVGAADPVGIQRLVRGLAELADTGLAASAVRVVVVNRVRASAAGPRPESAVRHAMARYAGIDELYAVPEDRAGFDVALMEGRTLGEVAPSSAARAAIVAVAEHVRSEAPAHDRAAGDSGRTT